MQVFTAGIGILPTDTLSVDLIYHHYRQHITSQELGTFAFGPDPNEDPNRRSSNLGHEIDLVVGMREVFGIDNLGIDIAAGIFFPGPAFRIETNTGGFEPADPAYFFQFEFAYEF